MTAVRECDETAPHRDSFVEFRHRSQRSKQTRLRIKARPEAAEQPPKANNVVGSMQDARRNGN
jgi:hypothetical protein